MSDVAQKLEAAATGWFLTMVMFLVGLPFPALIGDSPSRVGASEPRWSQFAQWFSAIAGWALLLPLVGLGIVSATISNANLDLFGTILLIAPLHVLLQLAAIVVSRRFSAARGVPLRFRDFRGLLAGFVARGPGSAALLLVGFTAMTGGLYLLPLRQGWLQGAALAGFYLVTAIGISLCRRFATASLARAHVQREATDRWTNSAAVALGISAKQMAAEGAIRVDELGRVVIAPVPGSAWGRLGDERSIETRLASVEPEFAVLAVSREAVIFGTASDEVLRAREITAESAGLVIDIVDEPDSPSRPLAARWILAPSTGPSKVADVDSLARSSGKTLVEFRPWDGYAIVATVVAEVAKLRADIAQLVKVSPWELEMTVARDERGDIVGVDFLRYPPSLGSKKRIEQYVEVLTAKLPAEGSNWVADDRPSEGRMAFGLREDKLAGILEYPWDAPVTYTATPFGVASTGEPICLGLLETNQLLGGIPGSGKSGGLTALLAGISRLDRVALIGLDPKKVELSPWNLRFSRIAKTEDFATTLLEALVAEMERRYDWLDSSGLKKITPAELSAARPLLVIVIDELADLVSIGVTREEKEAELMRSTMVRRLIAKGRAAGIVVVTATQKPQSSVIPTELRDLIQQRVAYSTTTVDMTDTILGAGMGRNGGLAHEIPSNQKGVCYIVSESSRTPIRARTYWIPDEQVASIAARTAHLRIELPWLPQPPARHVNEPETETIAEYEFTLDDLEPAPQLPECLGAIA